MPESVTQLSLEQFTGHVSRQPHAMAGAVIAASAALAAALGRACMQISLEQSSLTLDRPIATAQVQRMDEINQTLLDWCAQDATAIAKFVALREAGQTLAGQTLLCQAPAEISHLSIEAARLLTGFRSLVSEQVQDDLEMALTLLAGTAQAAMLLLDSNLRIWPEPDLQAKFEPVVAALVAEIDTLSPVARLR